MTKTRKVSLQIAAYFISFLLIFGAAEIVCRLKYNEVDIEPIIKSETRDNFLTLVQENRKKPYKDLVINGAHLTIGDLWGLHRLDPLLSYVTQEKATSPNNWWQNNNIGARARVDTSYEVPSGKKRILVFGDSYGVGSRLPQEETWFAQLEKMEPSLEIVNLSVDGYSMAQAYLRYLQMRERIDFDAVILCFVPAVDLWRDINIIRDLGAFWNLSLVMPRFELNKNELVPVMSIYADPLQVFDSNKEELSARLRQHLIHHDRFYFWFAYEKIPVISHLRLFQVLFDKLHQYQKKNIMKTVYSINSEAMQVSRKIFEEMASDVFNRGKIFKLIVLPSEIELRDRKPLQQDSEYDVKICADKAWCDDIRRKINLPVEDVDSGYDGGHYGPKLSQEIARLMRGIIDNSILSRANK